MSRTLSIDNIGPGLDSFEPGSGPFSDLNPPAATSACLSDARLRSLISARGASLRWTIRCYGWGCLVETTVCARGWRLRRSQKKRLGFAPTASDRTAGWDGSRYVVTAFPKASRSRPCSLSPSTSMRARGRSRRWPCSCGRHARASRPACRRASLTPFGEHGASRRGPALGLWPGLSNGESIPGSATPTRRARASRCLLPAFVMPPCRTLSPLECSDGVSPIHAANDLAFLKLRRTRRPRRRGRRRSSRRCLSGT